MNYPTEFRYTKEHEWAHLKGKEITVGVTQHAQNSLGDIVFVELPEVGRELQAGDAFGVVESVKAVSDLYAPATGKVTAVNSRLNDEPHLINQDPHGEAWLIKMELNDGGVKAISNGALMDSFAYEKLIATA